MIPSLDYYYHFTVSFDRIAFIFLLTPIAIYYLNPLSLLCLDSFIFDIIFQHCIVEVAYYHCRYLYEFSVEAVWSEVRSMFSLDCLSSSFRLCLIRTLGRSFCFCLMHQNFNPLCLLSFTLDYLFVEGKFIIF